MKNDACEIVIKLDKGLLDHIDAKIGLDIVDLSELAYIALNDYVTNMPYIRNELNDHMEYFKQYMKAHINSPKGLDALETLEEYFPTHESNKKRGD
jgi:hypothetical protein